MCEKRCNAPQKERDNNSFMIIIVSNNGMGFLCWLRTTHARALVNIYAICATLHGTKQMVIKIWHVNFLVNNKVIFPTVKGCMYPTTPEIV